MIDLGKIQELDHPGRYPEMLDEMYRQLDPLCWDKSLAIVDDALRWVHPPRFSDQALVGFLVITGALRAELPSRSGLFERIKTHLALSEPEDVVQGLLRGLE